MIPTIWKTRNLCGYRDVALDEYCHARKHMKYFEPVSKLIGMQDMNLCFIYLDTALRLVSADFITSCQFSISSFCSLTSSVPVIFGC